jgi:hypothetical protein
MMITMITNLPPPSSPPFVAELREARAENERLQDRVSMLNALLDEAVVAAAYKCYDCKHLFAALHNSPHSLASATVSSVRSEESKEPPLEEFTTVTAAATQAEIDMEFVRSLERQFAAQSLQADQSRVRK